MKKNILISGAGSALAQISITKLAKNNKLILLTSDVEKLKKKFKGPNFLILNFKEQNIEKLKKDLVKNKISINCIVHFNGMHTFNSIQNISKEKFEEFFKANCYSFLNLLKLVKETKISKKLYSILTISSASSFNGNKGISLYSSTKSALNNLVKSAALEFSSRKIRVNSIILGHINKGAGKKTLKFLNSTQLKELEARHPLGFGNDKDLFYSIEFLINEEKSRWITGTNFILDGGYLV